MIHLLRFLPAMGFTAVALTGIAALLIADLLGAETFGRFWQAEPARPAPGLDLSEVEAATGFTFFSSTPVVGGALSITTGVEFASWDDLLAGRQSERWCYVLMQPEGSLPRQITLGRQSANEAPVFADPAGWPPAELAQMALEPAQLASLARRHCRFTGPADDGADDDDGTPHRMALLELGWR